MEGTEKTETLSEEEELHKEHLRIDTKAKYISIRETVGYVMFDSSKTFGIDQYAQRFLLDVVKIDLGWQTIITAINSVWDIINDSFIGVIVDKTRTRFGKFRPYLIAFAIPGTIGTIFYWLTPMLFNTNPLNFSKAIYWLILAMLREGGGTFRTVAETGLLSTVTPNPEERMGILTKSELFSSFYENIPEWAMSIFIDLINNRVVNISMRSLYVFVGVSTAIVCCFLAMYCFLVTKERVQQSIEKPSVKQGIQTIIHNRPMLMLMLSDLLSSFTVDTGIDNYYIDVLGSSFIKTIITAPSALTYYASFGYAGWARKKFSTKQIWIFTAHFGDLLSIIVYLIGSIGGKGQGGFYQNIWIMVPVLMMKDAIWKATYGIRKIIPRELFNEAMDYCEWKMGYRTEGMTFAAKSMLTKIIKNTNNTLKTLFLKMIGYNLEAGFGKQSDRTKYLLFAMSTIVPALTELISVFPKFFYNIDHDMREKMYSELMDIRACRQMAYEEKDAKAISDFEGVE